MYEFICVRAFSCNACSAALRFVVQGTYMTWVHAVTLVRSHGFRHRIHIVPCVASERAEEFIVRWIKARESRLPFSESKRHNQLKRSKSDPLSISCPSFHSSSSSLFMYPASFCLCSHTSRTAPPLPSFSLSSLLSRLSYPINKLRTPLSSDTCG